MTTRHQVRDDGSSRLADDIARLCDEAVADEAQVMSALVIAMARRMAAVSVDVAHAEEGVKQICADLRMLVAANVGEMAVRPGLSPTRPR